jgi:F0F1-type ATP synthase assembly protein I
MTVSLLLVEYATSFPIGVSLYVIMDLGSSVYYIVRTIKNKRKQSA